jgi:5-methylcytosine-specific restriction endonuclease McrA
VSVPRSQTAVTSLSPACYKLQFSISHDTHDRLRRVQDLMRHTIPNGDVAAIFDRALTLLLREVERRRCAAADTPRPSQSAPTHSRHIPSSVRRDVWKRDEGRCTFVGANGRCKETGFLELHHVQPYAVGGAATAENIRLRCRAHNAYETSLFFGQEADIVREARPVWPRFAQC